MEFIRILSSIVKATFKLAYIWIWWIPVNLTIIAVALQFLVMYVIFGTVHTTEVKEQFEDSRTSYFFQFIVPFAVPMVIAVLSCFVQGKMSSSFTTIDKALAYRAQRAKTLPAKKVFEIARKTSAIDFLKSNDSDIAQKAKSGMEATYGHQPPNKIIEDFLKED
jgi:uncharacterized integral membrane protein